MKNLILVVLCTLAYHLIAAQDSLKLKSEMSLDLKLKHILSAINSDRDCFNCEERELEDNPFHHLAIYSGIDHRLTLNDKYTFVTGIYLEERSFSHGANTLNNLIVFPHIKLSGIDTFNLFGVNIKNSITAGDFWDEDFYDILRYYNIDFQGLKTKMGINNIWIGFYVIADLSNSIGFDLQELHKFSIEYISENWTNSTSIGFNQYLLRPPNPHPTDTDLDVSNYTRYNFSNKGTIQLQVAMRINPEQATGISAGAVYTHSHKNMHLKGGVRYYNAKYNLGYSNPRVRYASGNQFIDRQFYPLKNFYRDFNQWATVTQYIDKDILSVELTYKWEKDFYKKIGFFADIDFNLIYNITDSDADYYPAYDAGFQINYLDNLKGRISVTNKHMRLNGNHQTFNISKSPFFSYSLLLDLGYLKIGEKNYKM